MGNTLTAYDLYGRANENTGTRAASDAADRPISALRDGDSTIVTRLDTTDPVRLRKLLALGILPGVRVQVRRRSPCYLLQVGYSQFAVDEAATSAIFCAA